MTRPRIRTLKPELWQDEAFGTLSKDARLLFIGLITMADDEGRLRAMPSAIVGHVFPYDDFGAGKVRRLLAEIERSGLIFCYSVEKVPYVFIPGWAKHQKINRPSPSVLPAPTGIQPKQFTECSLTDPELLIEDSLPRARARVGADRIGSGSENPPIPPRGNRTRDRDEFIEAVKAYTLSLGITHSDGWHNVKSAICNGGARTTNDVLAWVRQWRPDVLPVEVAA